METTDSDFLRFAASIVAVLRLALGFMLDLNTFSIHLKKFVPLTLGINLFHDVSKFMETLNVVVLATRKTYVS